MKNLYNYFVGGTAKTMFTFDEDFDPNGFCVYFDADDKDERSGYIAFEPGKRHAVAMVYGDPEDLSAHIEGINLMEGPIGHMIVAEFEAHHIGRMYRAALLFTSMFLSPIDLEE